MGEKWSAYGAKQYHVSQTDGPTDVANVHYNVADMITIAVILKYPGPDRTSMFNYGFEDNGRASHSFRVWPVQVSLQSHFPTVLSFVSGSRQLVL